MQQGPLSSKKPAKILIVDPYNALLEIAKSDKRISKSMEQIAPRVNTYCRTSSADTAIELLKCIDEAKTYLTNNSPRPSSSSSREQTRKIRELYDAIWLHVMTEHAKHIQYNIKQEEYQRI